jgi:glutamate/tyrosine decarboxylase-like PLP-dependent enzyme
MRRATGLSGTWSGVIQDTASTCTLVALLCARERSSDYALTRGGLQAEPAPLIVYTSAHSHSSVDKAALLAGFGRDNVRHIPNDADYALRPDALEDAIRADLGAGRKPCAIVATTGTTATTALDPVAAMARIAREYGIWLHVDAAMAGSAMILPECRWMWDGVEGADSLVLNPHKWLGVGFDLSAYYCRDPQHLIRVMGTDPAFLRTAQDGQVSNFRDWHIQLGRRFRALKLWLYLLDEGVSGIRARIRRDLENAQWLAAQIAATGDWQIVMPVVLQTVCVRHAPPGLDEEALSAHNLAIARRINEGGRAYLTPSVLDGKQILRISIGAERTEREHVAALWDALRAAAA